MKTKSINLRKNLKLLNVPNRSNLEGVTPWGYWTKNMSFEFVAILTCREPLLVFTFLWALLIYDHHKFKLCHLNFNWKQLSKSNWNVSRWLNCIEMATSRDFPEKQEKTPRIYYIDFHDNFSFSEPWYEYVQHIRPVEGWAGLLFS